MFDSRLIALAFVFGPLSLLSFGGGQALVPEIQHQTVTVQHWMNDTDFADIFAIARAAPGPSTLIVALIGWQVAGFWGALVGSIAIFLPSSILVYLVGRWWQRNKQSPFRKAIEKGLAPVAVGLIFAGVVVILESAHAGWLGLVTTAAACATLAFTKLSTYSIVGVVVASYALLYYVFPVLAGS
ncbi:MAG TPA: chromate transporter [Stellaceae bacterium]|jgi:chromate transporter|nr:chromate transporter [Stellaceae bacterium]